MKRSNSRSAVAAWWRRPGVPLLTLLFLTLGVLPWALRLRVDTDLLAVLPEDAPAAQALRLQAQLFGDLERVYIMASAAPGAVPLAPNELAKAADALARELRRHPVVRSARSGLSPAEREYFRLGVIRRAPLYLDADQIDELAERLRPAAVARQVRELRALLLSPLGGALSPWVRVDPLGLAELLPSSTLGTGGMEVDLATGAFLSPNGTAALVVVEPATSAVSPQAGRRLRRALHEAQRAVGAQTQTELQFDAVGGPLYAAADEAILRRDLRRTVISSSVLGLVIMALGFGGLRRSLIALIPVVIALVWTAALGTLLLGSLSAVALGFAAILIGLGVDYGIHLMARAPGENAGSEMEPGLGGDPALRRGLIGSAVTTAAGFGTLGIASLRPLGELGILMAIGILSVLCVTLAARRDLVRLGGSTLPSGHVWSWLRGFIDGAVRFCGRNRKGVGVVAVAMTCVALVGIGRLEVSVDLRSLRPSDHPLLRAEKRITEHFPIGLESAAVLVSAADVEGVLRRAEAIAALLRERLPDETRVFSPADLRLPRARATHRVRRLAPLPWQAAVETLRRELREAGLAPRAFRPGLRALESFAAGQAPTAPPLPESLTRLVVRGDERSWTAVRVRLPIGSAVEAFTPALLEAMRQRAPDMHVASVARLGAELGVLARRDLVRLSLAALGGVALVALLVFRGRISTTLKSLTPVVMGPMWALGAWGLAGGSLDLISLAVLPILVGTGIDNGLHALVAARRDGAEGVAFGLREAGPAMLLATLTTAAGFGSLAFSRLPGLRHGGVLVAMGVISCLVVTLLLATLEPRRNT